MSNEKIRHTPGRLSLVRDGYFAGAVPYAEAIISAPHDCDVPGCEGRENKRRLEEMEEACRLALKLFDHAFPDRDFQAGPTHQRFAMLLISLERRLEAYPALVSALRGMVSLVVGTSATAEAPYRDACELLHKVDAHE